MKLTEEQLKELGFKQNREGIWYKKVGKEDAYFYYCEDEWSLKQRKSRFPFIDLRSSDGGDWSMVYKNIPSLEKVKEIEKVFDS